MRTIIFAMALITMSMTVQPIAEGRPIPVVSAEATASAHGGCQLTCSWTYSATGVARGPAVTGVLDFTNSLTATCSGATQCTADTRDPVTYPATACHIATMKAISLVSTVDHDLVHCP